ncbi:CDP-diacylglycerol--glycerol-3-phosphate 3-phosphatidyltransferase [Candidatus Woesearchaeota archaeon]|nr:CDP-diacylglycerol--glycerol-3-phosphate 3-phosphatidyltransferase [Candidatus Woesearchaeota archaeon]
MKFKFNIPNKITLIRVGLIPLFAAILLADIPYKNILSAFIFGMLSISDFLDGYFARKKKQVTEIGKLIDPIADKLLISTALIFLIGKGIDLWMAVAIIAREAIITSIRIYLLPSKIVVPASNFGKAKTVVQSIAIIFVLLQLPLGWHVMLVAVLLTVVSGFEYLIRIRKMTGNKIVNLPNIITLFRFLLIIPFVYYFLSHEISISLIFFAIITLSDKLDGISARLMNQKTELGSGLDSFTDWTLIISTFVLLFINGYMGALWVVLLIVPSIISGAMKMAYAKKQKVVPVTFVARISVGLTYVTIISILINFGYYEYLLTGTLIMVYLAMISYVFKALSMPKRTANRNRKSIV